MGAHLAALGCAATLVVACGGGPRSLPATTRAPTPVVPAAPRPTATTPPSTATPAAAPAAPARPCGTAPVAPRHYLHVVWIWMENHDWSSVIGAPDPPYLTGLARECATDTAWSSVGSPSLPNYLGAVSGSTLGVRDDGDPGMHSFAADNLFRQVRSAGGTERSYVESMPLPCDLVSSGTYAAKHNPAVYFDGPGDRAACHADDLPLTGLASVLVGGSLPTFTSITPDICDDMHSCPVATGDRWLAAWVPRILASPAYRSGTTVVVVVFDEPTPLANVVIAPAIRPGTVSGAPVDHYSLLHATEAALGLPLLGRAASARNLRDVLGF